MAIEGGIDITNPATLEARLWRGVSQVCVRSGACLWAYPRWQHGVCIPYLEVMLRSNVDTGTHVHASEYYMQGLHHVPEQAHRLHLDRLMASFQCRYLDNMTSERVDAEGVKNIAAAAKANYADGGAATVSVYLITLTS